MNIIHQNPITNNVGLSTVLLAIVFSLLIASIVRPFYSIEFEKYTMELGIIGVQGSKMRGCLGSCYAFGNNNCIGDDATVECQTIQALYILSIILVGLALILSIVADLKISSSINSFGIKNHIFASFSLSAMVMLILALCLIFCLPKGLLTGMSIKELFDNPEYVDYVHYKEAFYMSIVSIILLFFTTVVGFSVKNW